MELEYNNIEDFLCALDELENTAPMTYWWYTEGYLLFK